MEAILVQYLIQNGGIFGVFLVLAIGWIVYREKLFAGQNNSNKSVSKSDEVLKVLEELKAYQKTFDNHIAEDAYFAKDLRDNIVSMNSSLINLDKNVKDLWDWHSVKDGDGVPIWYVRKSFYDTLFDMEKMILSQKEQIFELSKAVEYSSEHQRDLSEQLVKVNEERVSELKSLLEMYSKSMNELVLTLEKIKNLVRPV